MTQSNMVVLTSLPSGLLKGLPDEDQAAIRSIVGQPVQLIGYDSDGRAEIEFCYDDASHTIWVDRSFISPQG